RATSSARSARVISTGSARRSCRHSARRLMSALERELRERFGERLQLEAPLSRWTSFKIGGPADLFVVIENEEELSTAKAAAWRAGVQCFCLGAGTNLLISDRGMRGLVVHLGDGFCQVMINETQVSAGAAAQFTTLVGTCVD